MDRTDWDRRYAADTLVWSAGPNIFVEQVAADLPVGTAVDLAAGEGRNALWLAERGWQATAVDFSAVALERARSLAAQRLGDTAGRFVTVEADLLQWRAETPYDLVIVAYLQVVEDERRTVMRAAAQAVAPGGTLLVVAHDSANLASGHGGPQNPAVLYTAQDVLADIAGEGLTPVRAEVASRPIATEGGPRVALDALLMARRA